MAEEKAVTQKLMDLVTPETDGEKLKELVSQFITPEDEEVLGGKDVAVTKVADSVAYMGPFAPSPATFDESAFSATAAFDLPPTEAKRLLEINRRMGVIEDAPNQPRRFTVSEKVVNAAKNQFLTQD
mgnify:CR=1 FL=1